jgi:4-amino-4-deoxy-L-arabinose transferase-like glycosyltransferase
LKESARFQANPTIEMKLQTSSTQNERLRILAILVLAGISGLVFIFIMPAWQHYDEPNHFEHVWLAANLERLPQPGDYSPKLSRQVLKSMIDKGFFARLGYQPELGPPGEKVRLPGYSQLSEPPLYYTIAALPLRLIADRSVAVQLYAARLVSWLFYLLTILFAGGIAFELTPAGHALRWMLPITIAFTPAFADLMTAVNNDAAAISISTALLWVCIRLVRRGPSLFDLVLLVGLAGMAALTKITSIIILVAIVPALLFAFLRGRWRWAAWGLLAAGSAAFLVATVCWDDPAGWYRNTAQLAPVRAQNELAPLDEHMLAIQVGAETTPDYYAHVFQHFPSETARQLAGKEVTFGFWFWSDREQRVRSPILRADSQSFSEPLEVTTEPKFYAFHTALSDNLERIWIDLDAEVGAKGSWIFVDGVTLAEGEFPLSDPPHFSTSSAETGEWGGRPFTNLIRNGSAENRGVRVAPWLDNRLAHYLPDQARPSLLLASLLDPAGGGYLYSTTVAHLFRTYWARFGWGNVPAAQPQFVQQMVLVFSLLGLLGAAVGGLRAWKRVPWDVAAVLAIALLPLLFMALTRGGAYLASPGFYIPTARYIYPAIIPLALLLSCGWLEISTWMQNAYRRWLRRDQLDDEAIQTRQKRFAMIQSGAYLLFFAILNLLSLAGVHQYFSGV